MITLYDLFPKKNGMYADELTYDVSKGCYYLLHFDPDGDGEFVEYCIFRRDIREAKKAYDCETDGVKKRTAFICSICTTEYVYTSYEYDEDFKDYARTYTLNVCNAVANLNSDCLIFFGLSTDENNIDLDEADRFIRALVNGFREDAE